MGKAGRAEEGSAGGDRPRCGPPRAGVVAARVVPQDGHPILHCQGQGSSGSGCAQEDRHRTGLHSIKNEDRHEFSQLITAIRSNYNDKSEDIRKTWGGGIMGLKSQAATTKKIRAIQREEAKRAQAVA